MTWSPAQDIELRELIAALREGALSAEQAARLNAILADSPAAREVFARHALFQASLELAFGPARPAGADDAVAAPLAAVLDSAPPRPIIIVQTDSAVPAPSFSLHSFIGTSLFSYAVATVLMAAAMLIAWEWKTPSYDDLADSLPRRMSPTIRPATDPATVGRITGTADCQWAAGGTAADEGESVRIGRRYALAAGFLELTYNTGAKVILQGPATYEVESPCGGFLSMGRLTARVEKKGTGVGGQEAETSVGSAVQLPNQRIASGSRGERTANPTLSQPERKPTASLALRPSGEVESRKSSVESQAAGKPASSASQLSTLNSRLFTVRTPTAVVTDMGTEFGVEVTGHGADRVHVFEGNVVVRLANDRRNAAHGGIVLGPGQSATTNARGAIGRPPASSPEARNLEVAFVRRIPRPSRLGTLNLLNIVCGGNGAGIVTGAGIDPTTGEKVDVIASTKFSSDNRYHSCIAWNPLIDGVFIPDGKAGPVQLDSAGHVFDGFGPTSGMTHSPVWARAFRFTREELDRNSQSWIYSTGEIWEFTPEYRGLLAMHSNVGLTFDLRAIARAHPTIVRPIEFRANAGITNSKGLADVWVFVDGSKKYERIALQAKDGAAHINVKLSAGDRFLTLVVTEGNDAGRDSFDWAVFGDPVLRVAVRQPEPSNTDLKGIEHETDIDNKGG
jgi:hypothetical protein